MGHVPVSLSSPFRQAGMQRHWFSLQIERQPSLPYSLHPCPGQIGGNAGESGVISPITQEMTRWQNNLLFGSGVFLSWANQITQHKSCSLSSLFFF